MLDTSELNLTSLLRRCIIHIVDSTESFAHIDPKQLLICIATNRITARGGTYAKLVPLRFKGGSRFTTYRNHVYTLPDVTVEDQVILYSIYFYMPRFFNLSLKEKVRVIFHELYHINPAFNGDIRRLGKKKAAHGASKKKFDEQFVQEFDLFIAVKHPDFFIEFLSLDVKTMYAKYKQVTGTRMQIPRPIPVSHR